MIRDLLNRNTVQDPFPTDYAAYYPLDGSSNGEVRTDASGNGNTLLQYSTIRYSINQSAVVSSGGQSVDFNSTGSLGVLYIPSSAGMQSSLSEFTVVVFTNDTSLVATGEQVFHRGRANSSSPRFSIGRYNIDGTRFRYAGSIDPVGSSGVSFSGPSINNANIIDPTMCVLSFKNGEGRFRVKTPSIDVSTLYTFGHSTINGTSYPLALGGYMEGDNYGRTDYTGKLDEIYVYTRQLKSSEEDMIWDLHMT